MHVFKKLLYNTYSRIVIFLFIRGIRFPGFQKIKLRLDASVYQKFERQKLIHDIKGERFRLRVGPFWFRSVMEKALLYFQKNKFLILIFSKITLSLLCISIPVSLFILVRGILPVPERVPYEIPNTKLNAVSDLHVDFPYTEGAAASGNRSQGLKNFGVGFFPVKLNVLRGFLVSEDKELVVRLDPAVEPRDDTSPLSSRGSTAGSTLRIGYYLQPAQNSKHVSCMLQIFNENNELLAQTTEITPSIESYSKYSIRNSWRKSFTPNVIPSYGHVGELKIPISVPPEKIIVKSFQPISSADSASESQCTFLVSDFSVEHSIRESLPRRGVIFIVADSLRANTAYDTRLMPKLNKFIKNGGLAFLEHRAQSNATFLSMSSLFTSRYPNEFSSDVNLQTLPLSLQALGYRVGAIGAVSSFTDAVQGGVDLGIHNAIIAEHSRYEGRHITELAGQWLEKYGEAPFFLYLHYNTMDNPYKPPFENIDFAKLSQNPFGLNQKQQLYRALARYLDTELQMLFQKLKDLGIFENVDIIFTSDHGVQLDKKEWHYFSGVETGLKGAYAGKGHSVFDEEIRVPLMMKIAGNNFPQNTKVEAPSAHLDLFPTLYNFMGGNSRKIKSRGLDFSAQLFSQDTKNISDILFKRKFLLISADKYAGVLAWNADHLTAPTKYIRQLAPDSTTLYLTKTPWKTEISWYQPELYSRMNFDSHKENWIKNLPDAELNEMRKIYSENVEHVPIK